MHLTQQCSWNVRTVAVSLWPLPSHYLTSAPILTSLKALRSPNWKRFQGKDNVRTLALLPCATRGWDFWVFIWTVKGRASKTFFRNASEKRVPGLMDFKFTSHPPSFWEGFHKKNLTPSHRNRNKRHLSLRSNYFPIGLASCILRPWSCCASFPEPLFSSP